MGIGRRGTQFYEPGILDLRIRKLSRCGESRSEIRQRARVDRVQRDSFAIKSDAPCRVPLCYGKGSRVGDKRRVRGSQCQSGVQRFAGSLPIKIEIELDFGADAQSLRQVGLDREGTRRSLARLRQVRVKRRESLGGKVAVPDMRLG